MNDVVRLREVRRMTGLARTTIYRNVAAGTLPRPFKLGVKAIGWFRRDIEAVMECRAAGGGNDAVRRLVASLGRGGQ